MACVCRDNAYADGLKKLYYRILEQNKYLKPVVLIIGVTLQIYLNQHCYLVYQQRHYHDRIDERVVDLYSLCVCVCVFDESLLDYISQIIMHGNTTRKQGKKKSKVE